MSIQRSPPASPRAPKIQQESWDDCGTPPIDLFDPCQTSPVRSPSRSQPLPSPTPKRKCSKPINVAYYESRTASVNSTGSSNRSFSYGSDQRSPKYENPPRSPKITTTYANDDDESTSSFYQTPTGSRSPKGTYYYDNHQSPRRSPKSPRKFVFDAISPSYEQKGKKFEYYDSMSMEEEDSRRMTGTSYKETHHHFHHQQGQSQQQQVPSQQSTSSSGGGSQKIRRGSKSFKARPLEVKNSSTSGMDATSLQGMKVSSGGKSRNGKDFTSGNGAEINEMMVIGSAGMHIGGLHYQPQDHDFRGNLFVKRDSCMTESTQLSGDSGETNTTTLTTTTTLLTSSETEVDVGIGIAAGKNGNGGSKGHHSATVSGINNGKESNGGSNSGNNNMVMPALAANPNNGAVVTSGAAGRHIERGRRHAINITSNPGYQQIIHSSHTALDRTCSDSVVSLSRCRKSTSDLTDINDGSVPVVSKPRRRGSSKGGLAYLASRRSSRDSLKSAVSNTSIFSNEDIGPLAFQASTRGRQRRTSNFLELPVPDHIRPRVCSLPDRPYNPRASDDLYRLRHFSISKGTVVNCGDSIISRRSRSNTSVNSTTSRASERSPFEGSCCGGGYSNVDSLPPSPTDSEPPPPPRYRVVMLGEASVGKTALVSQFMTSEYMHTYDASLDDEFGEKTVSVLLDDEESELVFIDHPSVEMSVENCLSTYEPHACIVAYSVVDRNSFRIAEEILNYLWQEHVTKEKAVILVGNKADLARSRVIPTTEGKALAASRDAKFIETSSGIQHNVDELLVGVLKQMRLKEKRDKKAAAMESSKMKSSRTHISLHLAKEILQKICLSDIAKSKSCENLHVL
ncbi:uncharacterized protein LOC119656024 isoform X3 [Hermetia illucens]|uniref:uncharacterized protein LOC119656024 isoform X3 n=1 Tax=Hermetia illucens TaxID=343691 RepID=UPI0018CC4528|nr:uncharacterized protein LOC119656024 isoform X3 [Hermetia illucens]